jgi:hypothetical protein
VGYALSVVCSVFNIFYSLVYSSTNPGGKMALFGGGCDITKNLKRIESVYNLNILHLKKFLKKCEKSDLLDTTSLLGYPLLDGCLTAGG